MIAISADWHLENYSSFSTVMPNRVNSRLWDQTKTIVTGIVNWVTAEKPTAFIFLGDWLAGMGNAPRDTIHKDVLKVGHGLFKSIAEVCPIYMIPGNHDYYTGGNYLQIFAEMKNVRIYMTPAIQPGKYLGFPNLDKFLFVPFPASHSHDGGAQWNEWMQQIGKVDIGNSWLLTHQGFSGHEFAGWTDKTAVPPPPFPFIISGHYHTPACKENVLYVGSPYQLTFNEEGQQKGFVVIDQAGDYNTWRFVNVHGPVFITSHVKSQQEYDKWYEHYKGSLDYYRLHVHDIKIRIHGDLNHRVEVIMDRISPVSILTEDSKPIDVEADIVEHVKGMESGLPKDQICETALKIWRGSEI